MKLQSLTHAGLQGTIRFGLLAILYLFTAILVLIRLGSYPGEPFNWETYTVWRLFPFREEPTMRILDLSNGVITDSGLSPLVILPAWLGFVVGEVSLAWLRAPIALIAALSVPLTWLVGRRLTDARTATIATLLLALTPSFLLYARTATNVGISVTPALVTIYALVRVLQNPRSWGWLAVLGIMLILNSYAYAVIRFLWPISLVLLAGELLWRRGQRRAFLLALLLIFAVLPAALVVIDEQQGYHPVDAITHYFNGRGEQVLALRDDPAGYQYYLEPTEDENTEGGVTRSTSELARLLIMQNAKDLGNLLLDRDTLPALTDYWNPHGRLYFSLLVPFFILGTAASIWRVRRVENRALLGLFWGFSLPLLLTSQIHIGRLIFAIPLLLLFVGAGITLTGTWLAGWAKRLVPGLNAALIPLAMAALVVLASGWSAWRDYRTAPLPTRAATVVAQLSADAPAHRTNGTDIAYIRDGANQSSFQAMIETIDVSGYRLRLNESYQFVNLRAGDEPSPADPRPVFYYGGLADHFVELAAMPDQCSIVFYVEPPAREEVDVRSSPVSDGCEQSPQVVALPE